MFQVLALNVQLDKKTKRELSYTAPSDTAKCSTCGQNPETASPKECAYSKQFTLGLVHASVRWYCQQVNTTAAATSKVSLTPPGRTRRARRAHVVALCSRRIFQAFFFFFT